MGFSSAIATESMIHTSQFELGGVIDSESFPPISVIKDGKPNFPTRIFTNENLKVGVFYHILHLTNHYTKLQQKRCYRGQKNTKSN